MWRKGARGARVSPDPWGSEDEEDNNTDKQLEAIEMERHPPPAPAPKAVAPVVVAPVVASKPKTPPREPSPEPIEPSPEPNEPDPEPSEPDIPKAPLYMAPIIAAPVKSNEMNGTVIPPKEPEKEFIYQRDPKKDVKNENLDRYLQARFSTATKQWTPYLGERRR